MEANRQVKKIVLLNHQALSTNFQNSDTSCSVRKISWSKAVDLGHYSNDKTTYLFQKKLYILDRWYKKIWIMDTNTGEVTESKKLNTLLNTLSTTFQHPNELFINSDYIYISFDTGVVALDNNYELKLKVSVQGNFKHFAVTADRKLLLFNEAGPVSLFDRQYSINESDKNTKEFNLDLAGAVFLKSDAGIYYSLDSLYTLHNVKDSIYIHSEAVSSNIKSLKPFYDDYPGFVSKDFVYFFPYVKRNKLIITDKKITRVIKTIDFKGFNWSISKDDQANEAGHPDFFIDVDGNNFFVTVGTDSEVLSVYKGCLNLPK